MSDGPQYGRRDDDNPATFGWRMLAAEAKLEDHERRMRMIEATGSLVQTVVEDVGEIKNYLRTENERAAQARESMSEDARRNRFTMIWGVVAIVIATILTHYADKVKW